MITLGKCKEILNAGKRKYNNEEIKEIRDYLYFLAELELEINNKLNNNTDEERNNIL